MDKAIEHSAAAAQSEWRDSVDSDFDALADQLQRCRTAREHWHGLADRLQSFAVPKVMTVIAVAAVLLLGLHLLLR